MKLRSLASTNYSSCSACFIKHKYVFLFLLQCRNCSGPTVERFIWVRQLPCTEPTFNWPTKVTRFELHLLKLIYDGHAKGTHWLTLRLHHRSCSLSQQSGKSWSLQSSSKPGLGKAESFTTFPHSRLALRTDLPGQTRSRGYWFSDRRLGHISRSSDKPVDTGYTLVRRVPCATRSTTYLCIGVPHPCSYSPCYAPFPAGGLRAMPRPVRVHAGLSR
jgi:hypothetical protein